MRTASVSADCAAPKSYWPRQDQHEPTATGNARHLHKQLPSICVVQAIMPKHDAPFAGKRVEGGPQAIAHALISHQPATGNRGVATQHTAFYSTCNVALRSFLPAD